MRAQAFVVAAGVGLAALPASAEWTDWIAETELAFEYHSNLNRSAFHADEEDDFRWLPRAAGGRVYQLGERTRLALTAELEGEIYHQFDELDSFSAGGRLELAHKLGIGPDVPVLRAHASARYWNLRDDIRDSPVYEAGLEVTRRFSPRLDAALHGLYSYRNGRTPVWEQHHFEVGVTGNYLLLDPLLLTAGYRYLNGDFDANCALDRQAEVLRREGSRVKAVAADNVFGGCVYRQDGEAHEVFTTLSYALGRRVSVEAGYRYDHGRGRDLTYRGHVGSLAVLFRY